MKPLKGNLDFLLIRASRGPFSLMHKTEGPSHIHIPKGKFLLRCLWKDGLPFHSKTGNQRGGSHSEFHLNYVKKSERALKDGVGWEEPG